MARVTLIATALAIALVGAWTSTTSAQTDTRDRTFLTFSGPVEMPGVRLDAGTYVFKLADTPSRNVVEVWDREEKHMVGHWLFVQAERPDVSNDTVVMFKETAAGTTPAVQFWYYPGEKIGKEFVYPKDQAQRIASRTHTRVLSTEGELSSESKVTAIEAANDDKGIVNGAGVPPQPEAQEARAPEPRDVQVPEPRDTQAQGLAPAPEPRPAPAPEPQAAPAPRTEPLPKTASPLELTGLIGLLSLAGAAGIRFMR